MLATKYYPSQSEGTEEPATQQEEAAVNTLRILLPFIATPTTSILSPPAPSFPTALSPLNPIGSLVFPCYLAALTFLTLSLSHAISLPGPRRELGIEKLFR